MDLLPEMIMCYAVCFLNKIRSGLPHNLVQMPFFPNLLFKTLLGIYLGEEK